MKLSIDCYYGEHYEIECESFYLKNEINGYDSKVYDYYQETWINYKDKEGNSNVLKKQIIRMWVEA